MKESFFDLLKKPRFSIALLVALALALYNILYESMLMGAIFLALIAVFIGVNVWSTRKA